MITKAPSIIIENASLSYENVILFERLNMRLPAGKWTCLLGPSGVGKTTLLRMIAGLMNNSHEVFKGNITCDNLFPLNQQIAYHAQQDSLLPWLNSLDNTLLGNRLRGEHSAKILTHAHELFRLVGLTDAMKKYPRQLSGGMRQRVALIRTLLENKPIILMDEPFSALDTITRFELQTLSAELLKDHTVLWVTHDPMEALRLADDIYILAGKPAALKKAISLNTPAPRNPGDIELMTYQTTLFKELTKAKALCL